MRKTSVATVAFVLIAVGCSSSNHRTTSREPAPTPARPQPATIAWSNMHNPLLVRHDGAVKDPALIAVDGGWVALYSAVDASGAWRIGIARSSDLATWTQLSPMPHDSAVEGEASPDVTRASDGTYVVTYQSFPHDHGDAQAKLYARTTADFTAFSPPIRLAATIHSGANDRLIDPALAWTPKALYLGYKYGTDVQHFEIARSTSGRLEGPWTLVGRPRIFVYGDTIENYQFIVVDGTQYLLATSNQLDRPELFTLQNSWLDWSPARELHVPRESWNTGAGVTGVTYEHANSAYLVDERREDGHFYLVYSDAPDMQHHDVIAIARSTDLVHWSVPPR